MSFDPQHLWEAMGWPARVVFLLLIVMGIACLYVGFERWVTFRKARGQSRSLAENLAGHFSKGNIDGALKTCQDQTFKFSYLGHLMEVGLKEVNARFDKHGISAARRAMERQSVQESADLKRGMTILATVGSTAPFVGLVGTIFGIINAFVGMAESGSGGLGAVSAGIAEALVETATGIAVALVGVWLFNYFTGVVTAINNDINVSIEEFLDWCEKRLLEQQEAEPDTELSPAPAK
jgi:biopolymer transport protein ExbB/TolQ